MPVVSLVWNQGPEALQESEETMERCGGQLPWRSRCFL